MVKSRLLRPYYTVQITACVTLNLRNRAPTHMKTYFGVHGALLRDFIYNYSGAPVTVLWFT